jgi:hypothetical protein
MHSARDQLQPASTQAHLPLLDPGHPQCFDELASWETVATQSAFGDRIDLNLQLAFSSLASSVLLAQQSGEPALSPQASRSSRRALYCVGMTRVKC